MQAQTNKSSKQQQEKMKRKKYFLLEWQRNQINHISKKYWLQTKVFVPCDLQTKN